MLLNNKRVLVTGGAGFVPSHVVDAFVAAGATVTALDNFSAGKRENLAKHGDNIQIIEMDICDKHIANVIENQDIVIHMAANADVPVSVKDPDYDFQNNVIGSYNVLKSCLGSKVQKVVFASSAAVYGEPKYTPMDEEHPTNPCSPYGAAKLAIEKLGFAYHDTFGLPFTAIRIFNTYGVRQPRYVMYDLIRKLHNNPNTLEVLGTGGQIRDYSYVTDTARAFVLAAKSDKAVGREYNVAGGNPLSIKDLAYHLISTLNLDNVDVKFTGKSWAGDITTLSADISKIKDELEFKARVSITEGVEFLTDWMEQQHERLDIEAKKISNGNLIAEKVNLS